MPRISGDQPKIDLSQVTRRTAWRGYQITAKHIITRNGVTLSPQDLDTAAAVRMLADSLSMTLDLAQLTKRRLNALEARLRDAGHPEPWRKP